MGLIFYMPAPGANLLLLYYELLNCRQALQSYITIVCEFIRVRNSSISYIAPIYALSLPQTLLFLEPYPKLYHTLLKAYESY